MRKARAWSVGLLAGCLWASSAGAAWIEARTDHFSVYSDDDPARVKAVAIRLERFDKGIRKLRGLSDPNMLQANPVTVYVVPNIAAVQKLCNGLDGHKLACTNSAGFYEGRAEGSVAFMPRHAGNGGKLDLNAETVLLHEYSHHIMLANFSGAFPAWFVEGFAEFHSTATIDDQGRIGFGRPAAHRFVGLILGTPLKMSDLLTTDGVKAADGRPLSAEQRESLYGRGWLLTHYLTFEPSRAGQLAAYLTAMDKGKSSLDAAKAAFGDLPTLDRDLTAYVHRRTLSYYALPVDDVAPDAIHVRALSAGEAAMMPVRLRSDRGVDRVSAALVAADARRLAAPYPADPGAQDALAEAEYDAGNDDAAETAADRALKASPTDRTAMMYEGRVRVRRAEQAHSTDAKVWTEARSWFVKANRAQPDDAAPLYLFYRSFLIQGVRPTANAVTGLERAFDLAPQDGDLRFLLARQYLIDHRLKEARVILAPLAFDPHAAPDNAAAAIVALIDKGDEAAIAARIGGAAPDEHP